MAMTINNITKNEFEGLKVEKIFKTDTCETLIIRLQANHTLPKHTTPKEALLVIHQGEVVFRISESESVLISGDTYKIPINEEHSEIGRAHV